VSRHCGRFAVEVCEDDLVGEEGDPLEGSGAVGVCAAEQVVLAVRQPDKLRLTELADDLVLLVERNPIVQFHMAPW
jgi:hypothetical protein